jgi:hypothetical protein
MNSDCLFEEEAAAAGVLLSHEDRGYAREGRLELDLLDRPFGMLVKKSSVHNWMSPVLRPYLLHIRLQGFYYEELFQRSFKTENRGSEKIPAGTSKIPHK